MFVSSFTHGIWCHPNHHIVITSQRSKVEILERLGRLSPTMDDKYSRPEAVAAHLRAFDAVRDKALWKQLEKLLDPLVQVRRLGDL